MSDDLFDIFQVDASAPPLGSDESVRAAGGGSDAAHTLASRAAGVCRNSTSVGESVKMPVSDASDVVARHSPATNAPPEIHLPSHDSTSATRTPSLPCSSAGSPASQPRSSHPSKGDLSLAFPDSSCLLGQQPLALLGVVPTQLTSFPTSSASSSTDALTVIRSTATSLSVANGRSSESRSARGGEGGVSAVRSAAPAPSTVFTETSSGIRVRRATASLEQFTVRLAEYPFASFDLFRSMARRSGEAVTRTCVGVVVRRSDPKQNASATRSSCYAVLVVWNMEGISPTPEHELRLLLCGSAFDLLYSKLVTGTVAAFSNVARCTPQRSPPSPPSSAMDAVLLRIADHTSVRLLGFAADLGTCASLSAKSQERCGAMVNTHLSKHCAFHLSDLRKVARGGGVSGDSRRAAPPIHGTAPPARKGGTLASVLTPSARPHTGAVFVSHALLNRDSAGCGQCVNRSSSGVGGIAAPVTTTTVPSNRRLTASQQMLRQTSFLAVSGSTGLPAEDAALRSRMNSAGSGIYGGVQGGAPLTLRDQVGLQPATSYPSAQNLGVTSRGRDVLEAARLQAISTEEERLWRQTLRGKPQPQGAADDAGRVEIRKTERSKTRSTAKGEGGHASAGPAVAAPMKRVRVETATSADGSSSSPQASAASSAGTASATALTAEGRRVAELQREFQPLHRTTPSPFTPLCCHGAVHTVIDAPRQKSYQSSVVMSNSAIGVGGRAAASQHALLRAAAKAAKDVAVTARQKDHPHTASLTASLHTSRRQSEEDSVLPLTLLGAVADGVSSAHDDIRCDADRLLLLASVDKQIAKEEALEVLEATTEQHIKATFCYGCRCWYTKPPTTCVEQHHRTELKRALKKYIKCEYCGYKTFIIGGDDAHGWKVYPKCPRCHATSVWIRGDAAPQTVMRVDPLPLA